jgi:peptide/nickel transport system ATP-binding protein
METEQNGNNILVDVQDLKTYFSLTEGVVHAVNGVSFSIKRGHVLGVVGESGCGKSVTARSIMNMIRPPGKTVGGKILYRRRLAGGPDSPSKMTEDLDLLQLPPMGQTMRSIRGAEFAMIFQEPRASLSPVHTIGQQIMEGVILHTNVSQEEARDHVIELLRRVNIPKPEERIDAYPHQLSGGMCQRAMIATALACRPVLLIADEPTTALDVTTEAQILEMMKGLQQTYETAIMYITHDLAVIAEMAREVVVMYLGMDVEFGPVEDIFYDPRHPYTRALLESIPTLGKDVDMLTVIPGTVPDAYELPTGCFFHPRCKSRMPVCSREDVPVPRVVVDPGHYVRCHLYA